ncbi:MAG TPA: MFS transporter [Bryobacteraceae bacterium]|nr:MFS transporter [Bryobacteraceae bacterium]
MAATAGVWTRVLLLSLGGFFEYYDLFFTGYIAPGLVRSGLLTPTARGLFGTTGIAGFVAAMFAGLFIGTALVSFVADRFGRRTIFTFSLLWYTAASVVMAFQHNVFGLNFWRFVSGIGVGVELVTIDAYIAELVPAELRGRAFAYNQVIQFTAVPVVALLAWRLVPLAPLGLDGWRWVVLLGAAGAIFVWWIRRRVPESPRWLGERAHTVGGLREMWRPPYRTRSIMLIVFNLFQTAGFYGFSNWVPTLLIQRGIATTSSLQYTFIIAIAAPFGPLAAAAIADRFERKWQIVWAAAAIAVSGLLFAQMTAAALLILFGVVLTLANNMLSFSFHAYQAELFPTRIRASAVGFVYSFSRLSVVFSSFVIGFVLDRAGVPGVFALIAGSMVIVMLAIGLLGPRTNRLALEVISR